MAMDALTGFLKTSLEDGGELPTPADFETAKERAVAAYRELDIPPKNGTLYLLVPADPGNESFLRPGWKDVAI